MSLSARLPEGARLQGACRQFMISRVADFFKGESGRPASR